MTQDEAKEPASSINSTICFSFASSIY